MTTKRRRGRAAAKKQWVVTMPNDDGPPTTRPAPEIMRSIIEQLVGMAAAGHGRPLDEFCEKMVESLGARALEHAASVTGGNITAELKLRRREARVARIRERFPPQPDRAACIALRAEVVTLLETEGHVPPLNLTRQVDEIVAALVT